ncbi:MULTISPECIES: MFS transporter [Pseudomonadaceae]|uniref:MFS transporter n=1 Tax=Ectopseudomonas oleovorans TaxID=301 RepID=A0A2T5PK54_ECTOL|nr:MULTISPECIES: MFS transporter [Pseudomonas]WGL62542.1 MFS transporter [Pseudomonas sp. CW003PS]MCR1826346.1 MFS transporter [Pseudomonas oleovorans]MDH0567541.1 MFS transporter [Pseudomonas oleovorans]MDH2197787.1 MFS transporter [Pseudomonas oleovorans]PTU78131.1 MFS transporter [Pseudomonas indoloxydans]
MSRELNATLVAAVLAVGFMVMFLSSAMKGLYQVYFVDLATHFGEGRAGLALAGALFVLTIGLASPLVGWLSDSLGPLRTVALGSLCGGAVLLGVALFDGSLSFFVLLYGLFGAFALAAMTYVPMGILVDRLVGERSKAFAFAIVTNGTAIGFIVLSPLWIWLEQDVAWQRVFLWVGLLFALPMSLALYWVSRAVPLMPEAPRDGDAGGSLGFLLKDPRFFILALSFASCGATMAFIDVHLVPYWQGEKVPASIQASGLSLLGVLELGSGLLAGWLATRHNKGALLGAFYLLRCAAVAVLLLEPGPLSVYLFAALFGASYLGTVVLTSAFCFSLYGDRIKGKVFGILFLVHQLGALAVTQLGALDFDRNQSYQITVMALLAATLSAAVLSFFLIPAGAGYPRLAARTE